jgi:hypothetical protein
MCAFVLQPEEDGTLCQRKTPGGFLVDSGLAPENPQGGRITIY